MAIDFTQPQFQAAGILASQLAAIDSSIDTSEGSLVQTTLGPQSLALQAAYSNMATIQRETYVMTATGSDLDLRIAEAGITRNPATAPVLILMTDQPCMVGTVVNGVPTGGTRFATNAGANSLIFMVTSALTPPVAVYSGVIYSAPFNNSSGYVYEATCLSAGSWNTLGGTFTSGNVTAVDYVAGISIAYLTNTPPLSTPTTTIPAVAVAGTDAETDAALLQRYINKVTLAPFGGNFADYYLTILGQLPIHVYPGGLTYLTSDGTATGTPLVGGVQIYPAWQGGGSVKCAIVDSTMAGAATGVVSAVQAAIDPSGVQGMGYGMAPIGATVSIVGATPVTINVAATVTLASTSVSRSATLPLITAALAAYIAQLQQEWDATSASVGFQYALTVFNVKLAAAIVDIAGVQTVAGVTITKVISGVSTPLSSGADCPLTETSTTQQIPVSGTFTPTWVGGCA